MEKAHQPITKALQEILDDGMAKLRVKFDIAHFIAVEMSKAIF